MKNYDEIGWKSDRNKTLSFIVPEKMFLNTKDSIKNRVTSAENNSIFYWDEEITKTANL